MKPILENDTEFICDIQAPCFQMLSSEEAELVRSSKTQVLFRKDDNLTKQGAFASYKQMNGRMADTLLYIDSLKNEKPEIFQLLSRKDLADFAGISTESTVKLLKMFEKDGLIALNEKDLKIVKYDALREISRRG